ncbi:hypothetical protein H5410_022644 [Solanum commersonii]|uniref:Uncharacterized protein n=1 Tax=Solanum commersonii TaxID=4109 RepID=A0A9J5ZEM3_SOLCO|nr:hypothetical protein H5410_022644 [Solanum commersonii]
MPLKSNPTIKPLMVTLRTSAYEVPSQSLESLGLSDENEEDNMLAYALIKWLGKGISHLGNKEVDGTKEKKKTYGRQHSWNDKVTKKFVPRHLLM